MYGLQTQTGTQLPHGNLIEMKKLCFWKYLKSRRRSFIFTTAINLYYSRTIRTSKSGADQDVLFCTMTWARWALTSLHRPTSKSLPLGQYRIKKSLYRPCTLNCSPYVRTEWQHFCSLRKSIRPVLAFKIYYIYLIFNLKKRFK